jgi:hypothetical protein
MSDMFDGDYTAKPSDGLDITEKKLLCLLNSFYSYLIVQFGSTVFGSSSDFSAYTKSDTVNFDAGAGTKLSRYIYVGTGGDVALVKSDNTVVIQPSVVSGSYISVSAKRINSISTTASGFVVYF